MVTTTSHVREATLELPEIHEGEQLEGTCRRLWQEAPGGASAREKDDHMHASERLQPQTGKKWI